MGPAAMTQHAEDVARVSHLAIRQPAVMRLLESMLAGDGDALGAGLELACRLVEQSELADGAAPPRVDHATLARGVTAVETGACDGGLTAWVTRQLEALPVALTCAEQARVAAAIAAILWALAEQRAGAGVAGDDVLA